MGPDWKLDRRDSGRLFWRRDSKSSLDSTPFELTPPPSNSSTPSSARERVKFRYDVEVLEFWEQEDHVAADEVFEDDTDMPVKSSDMTVQSVLVCVGCIGVILATISYQWLDIRWLGR